MALIKVQDIAFVRFQAPDLDAMESFLVDFGMVRAERTKDTLYMRGTDPDPLLHVTHLGEPRFLGVAFEALSIRDVEAVAKAEKVSVEPLDGPGGGSAVKLTDPNGFTVEVVAGREQALPIHVPLPEPTNTASEKPRQNLVKRVGHGPSHVKRLGHCALNVKDFRESEAWYKSRFGFITSDAIDRGSPDGVFGALMRCDRGELPSDHHTVFLMGTGKPKFNHAAFEVGDFDDLMTGNVWLQEKQRHHEWGVGRHILGSQIFDYWRDPWGNVVEHWTDGDLLDAAWGSRRASVEELHGVQWGPLAPPTMGIRGGWQG